MAVLSYIQTNLFALAILTVIIINMRQHSNQNPFEKKLFNGLLLSNTLMLVLDTVLWITDGKPGLEIRYINIVLTCVYYIVNPIPGFLWFLYVHFQVYRNEARTRRLLLPLHIPMLINMFLSVVSGFAGYQFYFDSMNVYHRGSLFWTLGAVCYFYLFGALVYTVCRRNYIEKRYYYPLLLFSIPPIVGGLLQFFYYGISLVWICMTLSALVVFINVQNDQLSTDYLTGLCNRRQMDSYLNEHKKSCRGMIAGIMIDIDSFKQINDVYGHSAGDQALENSAIILRKSFRKDDLVVRYGGDEFIILFEVAGEPQLQEAVERIYNNINQFNCLGQSPYRLAFSMGYDILDQKSGLNAQEFLNRIDERMYEDKKHKKSEKNLV